MELRCTHLKKQNHQTYYFLEIDAAMLQFWTSTPELSAVQVIVRRLTPTPQSPVLYSIQQRCSRLKYS